MDIIKNNNGIIGIPTVPPLFYIIMFVGRTPDAREGRPPPIR